MALVYYNESELTNGRKVMRLDLSNSEKTFALADELHRKAKAMQKEAEDLREKAESRKVEECIKHIQKYGCEKTGIVNELDGQEHVRSITFWFKG